jgi:hypothetical protein
VTRSSSSNIKRPIPQDDARAFAGATYRQLAERQASVTNLQRAVRRCARGFGDDGASGILAVVASELGQPGERPKSSRGGGRA